MSTNNNNNKNIIYREEKQLQSGDFAIKIIVTVDVSTINNLL